MTNPKILALAAYAAWCAAGMAIAALPFPHAVAAAVCLGWLGGWLLRQRDTVIINDDRVKRRIMDSGQ